MTLRIGTGKRTLLCKVTQVDSITPSRIAVEAESRGMKLTYAMNVSLPIECRTIGDVLAWRALQTPKRLAYVFLGDGEQESERWTYGELDARASSIAESLLARGQRGDRVLLVYPPGLEFVAALFGCFHAGMTAVPAIPDPSPRAMRRFREVVRDARAAIALAPSFLRDVAVTQFAGDDVIGGLRWCTTDQIEANETSVSSRLSVNPGELALLQYTSGSTSTPKGVPVSHANLFHAQKVIQAGTLDDASSTFVGWAPVYHDMGLIANVLQPVFLGALSVLMPPTSFLEKPRRWLAAITKYRARTSGGPNFAYELCVRRITPDACQDLELSSWRIAFNSAEPVRAATMRRFQQRFSAVGFRWNAFYPCYGLAEATLLVTGGAPESGPSVLSVDGRLFESNIVAPVESDSQSGARQLVGSGKPLLDTVVEIVDPHTGRACAEDEIGEICVRGQQVVESYWGDPQSASQSAATGTNSTAARPLVRTGDLGFVRNEELFVTGRLKDIIIVRGRNLYPQDIEQAAETAHLALRPGCAVAIASELSDEERLILIQEVRETASLDSLPEVAAAIRAAIADACGVRTDRVILVQARSILKTSSGKLQRRATLEAYLSGNLKVILDCAGDSVEPPGAQSHRGDQTRPTSNDYRLEQLRSIVEQMLREEGHAVPRDFAERPLAALGVDSLLAAKLAVALREATELPISSATLLRARSLVDVIAKINPNGSQPPVISAQQVAIEESLPPAVACIDANSQVPISRDFSAVHWWTLLYLFLIVSIPATMAVLPVVVADHIVTRTVAIALSPWIYGVSYCCVSGLLSLAHQHAIIVGALERNTRSAAYRHRRLYNVCWTALFYFKPLYYVVLTIPFFRRVVFRLFGYRGSLEFTLYPDTWIRDLPLLEFGTGAYIANRATLGTNMVLGSGRIIVDRIRVGANAVVGHLAAIGPGTRVDDGAEIGVGAIVGIGVTVGAGAIVSPCATVYHHARLGKNSVVGPGVVVGPYQNIPANTEVLGDERSHSAILDSHLVRAPQHAP